MVYKGNMMFLSRRWLVRRQIDTERLQTFEPHRRTIV